MPKFLYYIDLIGDKVLIVLKSIKNGLLKLISKAKSGFSSLKDQLSQPENGESNKKRIIGLSVVAIVAIMCLFLIVGVFGARSINDIAREYLKVSYDVDSSADKVIKMYPEELIDYLVDYAKLQSSDILNDSEILEYMSLQIKSDAKEDLMDLNDEIGYGWTYTYKIETLELGEDYIEKNYGQYLPNMIGEYKNPTEVIIYVSFFNDNKEIYSTSYYITVAKKGLNWYLLL